MRLVRVLVPDERRSDVYATLDERGFDYFLTPGADRFADESIVEVPVSDEGVGDVIDALSEANVDVDRYASVQTLEWAESPNAEAIRERYADRYDRASREELRSQADELNWDVRSFLVMLSLSAIVATIGILLDSPVVVVGSAVIAPLVNPMLVSGIGTVVGEAWMVRDSLRLQALGLLVAVGSALAVGLLAEAFALAPATLDLPALDMVETRLAPNALAVLVGVAAGAAAAVSLTAETSLINIVGVMVAAALIPAAAVVGVALAWGSPLIALGSAVLLVATVVAIDLAILATFLVLGYRPPNRLAVPSRRAAPRVAAVALVLGVVLAASVAGTAGQVGFERSVNEAVDDVLSAPEFDGLSPGSIRTEYADLSPFTGPETVIVEVSRPDDATHPAIADRIADRIAAETGREVEVRVEFLDRQESS